MEKRKLWITLIMLVFVFSVGVWVVDQGALNAGECRLIRIHGQTGGQTPLGLEPETVTIEKGTCLIWVNLAREEEVQVVFEEGKACKDVTKAPVGFKMDAKSCYVTNYIPFGATSSLLFDEEGVFKYILKAGKSKLEGKIVVRASS